MASITRDSKEEIIIRRISDELSNLSKSYISANDLNTSIENTSIENTNRLVGNYIGTSTFIEPIIYDEPMTSYEATINLDDIDSINRFIPETFELGKETASVQLEIKEILERTFSFVKISNYKELKEAYQVFNCFVIAKNAAMYGDMKNAVRMKDERILVVRGVK